MQNETYQTYQRWCLAFIGTLLGLHIIPTCLVFYKFGTSIPGAPHQPPASIGMTPLTGRNVDRDGLDDPWPASEVASRKIFGTWIADCTSIMWRSHLLLLIWFLKITWNLLMYQIPCYGESWWTNQDSEKGNSFQKVLSAKRSWQSLASPNSKTWRSPECLRFWASNDGSWKKRCFCLFQIFSRVFAAVLREPSRAQSCVMCLVNGKEWQGCFFGCFYGDHWPCHRIKGVASPKPFSKVFKSHQSQGCSYIQ